MTKALFFALLMLVPFEALAQSSKPDQSKDSVTVSAGIPKEQLVLEDKLNATVSQGDQFLRNGNASDAINQYRNALDLIQKEPLLVEQEPRVQRKLAVGYMRANQPSEAIPIYSKLLDARKQDCGANSEKPWDCADAEYELGRAKMYAADFAGALVLLNDADSKYAQAEKLNSLSHEFAMIQLKSQSETKILVGVALFRTGKTSEAITTVDAAIVQLIRVQSDETITVGIRDDASRHLQEAQTILSRLKSTQ
jgi:tetratricopeptide (TPR) repeat protein